VAASPAAAPRGTVVTRSREGAGGRLASVRSRLRFIIAISLAVGLGAWLAWTSIGGSLETYAGPSELAVSTDKTYRLNGTVAPGAPADAAARAQSSEGLRFTVVDKEDPTQRVPVLYRGSVPDQFKVGREVVVTGSVEGGTFVARNDSLITLCPSKFTDRPEDTAT
jgi:cytochrome c-type biogenesis protein CcmE